MDADDSHERDVKQDALDAMDAMEASGGSLPKLVVLDLDYTIWPFWCECRLKSHKARLYKEAKPVLEALRERGVALAVASRTPTPDMAAVFLRQLDLDSWFAAKEIYPSSCHKMGHFKSIQKATSVPYRSMLFFDDEQGNIGAIQKLGVTSILVEDGFNLTAFRQGLAMFAKSGSGI